MVLASPHQAPAYSEAIHSLIEERALPIELRSQPLPEATLEDADALRREIYRVGAAHPDLVVRARFLARYPGAEAFDPWAFKDFLGLNPDRPVLGIDQMPGALTLDVGAVLALAARAPDDDRRNQERFAHDAERRVVLDPYGQPLPADPAQLAMGSLYGTPSQAYAHYGLPRMAFSDSPDVLKADPRRFAYPRTARAFAAAFAQLHTDLAICAATLGRPGGMFLGWWFLGNAHHYVQDVANQIHTLQAIYGFFRDAKLESYLEELRSLGGVVRSRPDFVTIGILIIKNHHLLAEDLFAKRVHEQLAGTRSDAAIAGAIAAIATGHAQLEHALDAARLAPDAEFGRMITEEVIELSSHEGGEVYELIRALARRSLSRASGNFDSGMDPDGFLRHRPDPARLARFYALQAAGFGRAGSAVTRHVRLYQALLAAASTGESTRRSIFEASAARLVSAQLAALEAREAHHDNFVPRPPRREDINWLVPGVLGMMLIAVTLVVAWIVRRCFRRRARAGCPPAVGR